MRDINNVKIGCIGCGTMGGAVVKAMCNVVNPKNIYVSAKHFDKVKAFAEETGVNAVESNCEVAKDCDYLFLAVKPAYIVEVLGEVRQYTKEDTIFISMAAGIKLENLSCHKQYLSQHFIRIMPNLPATVGEAMTALCVNDDIAEDDVETVKKLLSASGKVEQVGENLMDGVTAISGSGPAYGFMFIEALADAAVKFGIPRKQAYIYAAQTLKGAAELALKDSRSISELKDAVCSPGGTTIEAVITLEEKGFRGAVIDGATASYKKSIEMSKK